VVSSPVFLRRMLVPCGEVIANVGLANSPITVPQLGRNIPYITTFALFTILTLPTALVDNLDGFLFLRFLLGFFGSPCLANGGATMQDLYSLLHIPYGLAFWTAAAFAGPALGPLLSGFSVYAENWRWYVFSLC